MDTPPQKAIFRYWNGAAWVWGDPLRIQRDLYVQLGDADDAFKASAEGNSRADNVIVDNARVALGMVPFDRETGAGATDSDVEAALAALWDFLEKKSASTASSPTSSAPITSTPTASPPTPSSA